VAQLGLTSHPHLGAIVLTLQLVVFVVAMRRCWHALRPLVPVVSAFLLCIAASALAAAVFPAAIGGREPLPGRCRTCPQPARLGSSPDQLAVPRYYPTGGQGAGRVSPERILRLLHAWEPALALMASIWRMSFFWLPPFIIFIISGSAGTA